jgi:hypothetical protein
MREESGTLDRQSMQAKSCAPLADVVTSIHPVFRGHDDFLDVYYQILSYIHLPSRLYADAHVGGRFANNVAEHWNSQLAENDEHQYRFAEPG